MPLSIFPVPASETLDEFRPCIAQDKQPVDQFRGSNVVGEPGRLISVLQAPRYVDVVVRPNGYLLQVPFIIS